MALTAPAGTIADGLFLYSSLDITFGTGGTSEVYYSKTIRLTRGVKKIERTNSAAVVIDKSYILGSYFMGSADLKYSEDGTPTVPMVGSTFTMTIPEISATAMNFIVTQITPSRTDDAEAMCGIEFDQTLHTVTVGT